jgi:1-phosphofructokinase
VFAPAPIVTVSVELRSDGDDEIHVHAGGQGVWVARLLAKLGVEAVLCATLGGETGGLLRHLSVRERVRLASIAVAGSNGAYVHDRRTGERDAVATMPSSPLTRHEVDDLYGLALTEGLAADLTVLTGPQDDDVVPDDVYRRLAGDLRTNGRPVVADLSGRRLEAALAGGLDLVKVSDDELRRDGRLDRAGSLGAAIRDLAAAGADQVVVTLGDERSVALVDGVFHLVRAPTVEALDPTGAGDSFTAATVAALVSGAPLLDSLARGSAAGATNVARRGLASGRHEVVEALTERVTIEPLSDDAKELA